MGYCALFYVLKFFWPFHLTAIYPTFEEMDWQLPQSAAWLLALVVVCGTIFALRRRVPLLLPAWLFYLVTLSPTIGLIPVGAHVVADRFSYLPLIGLALPVSVGLVSCGRRIWALVLVFVIGLVLLTHTRTAVWRNTETLFGSVLEEYPKSYPALVNLTVWYTSLGRTDEAIAIGQRAVAAAPAGLIGRRNLARALIKAHRYREAVGVLRPIIEHGIDDFHVLEDLHECFVALGDDKNARVVQERMAKMALATTPTQ
jgi:tetratricopeptide (TPR) repeat protein